MTQVCHSQDSTAVHYVALLSRKLKCTEACGGKIFCNILIEVLTFGFTCTCIHYLSKRPFCTLAHFRSDHCTGCCCLHNFNFKCLVPTSRIYMFYTYRKFRLQDLTRRCYHWLIFERRAIDLFAIFPEYFYTCRRGQLAPCKHIPYFACKITAVSSAGSNSTNRLNLYE